LLPAASGGMGNRRGGGRTGRVRGPHRHITRLGQRVCAAHRGVPGRSAGARCRARLAGGRCLLMDDGRIPAERAARATAAPESAVPTGRELLGGVVVPVVTAMVAPDRPDAGLMTDYLAALARA